MNSPPLRYRLLIALLSPVFAVAVLSKAWQLRSKRFALQRLGLGYGSANDDPLWVHCASVGEVTAALPLIERLKLAYPDSSILVSTTTPTGAETIQRQNWPQVQHVYLPVDTQWAVARLFAVYKPSALIIMETELWPNLINQAASQQLPVVIVNGRLSKKTLRAPAWFKVVYRQALSKVTAVLAKSDQDAKHFETLGATPAKIAVLGNLKFAQQPYLGDKKACDIQRPFWLAASTHEDEELQLCKALLSVAKQAPNSLLTGTLLIIAPRHPERSAKIQQALDSLKVIYAVRSNSDPVESNTQVYLADTLGEMKMWLNAAEVVFMGGTLVSVGGHNFLEPAAAGVVIVSGQHTENFQEEADLLLASGSLMQVSNAAEVVEQVMQLLSQPQLAKQLGEAGREAVKGNADVLQRYVDTLLTLVPHK